MVNDFKLDEILFLDIETVPQYSRYEQMPDEFKKLWDKKAKSLAKNEETTRTPYMNGQGFTQSSVKSFAFRWV